MGHDISPQCAEVQALSEHPLAQKATLTETELVCLRSFVVRLGEQIADDTSTLHQYGTETAHISPVALHARQVAGLRREKGNASSRAPVSAGRRDRADEAMAHIDFINIAPYVDKGAVFPAPSIEDFLPGQSQKGRGTQVTQRSFSLPYPGWRLGPSERSFLSRLSKFLLVGGMGVLVNSLALLILYQWAHLLLVVASALSAELAIVNNFFWHDRWTFERRASSLGRFAQFNLVSLGGLIITTFTLWALVQHLGISYLVANLLGIGLATAWNFAANLLWTWGGAR